MNNFGFWGILDLGVGALEVEIEIMMVMEELEEESVCGYKSASGLEILWIYSRTWSHRSRYCGVKKKSQWERELLQRSKQPQ